MAGFEVTIEGTQQLTAMAATLRSVAAVDVPREMTAALVRGAPKAVEGARQSMRARLPQRGGLARRAAAAPIRVTGANQRVEIVGEGLGSIDAGTVTHPTYGHRDRMVSQRVTPNTFTDGIEGHLDAVTDAVNSGLDNIGAKLTGR